MTVVNLVGSPIGEVMSIEELIEVGGQVASLGITQSLLAHRESSKRARFAVTGRLIFTKMTETRIEKRLKSIACIMIADAKKGGGE